jgi:formate dehydrogenase accessory protein FdhD
MKHPPIRSQEALRYTDGGAGDGCVGDGCVGVRMETLAEETPVAMLYNGRPHAVMMATPADLEDFAYGFTVTEDIAAAGETELVDVLHTADGVSLQMLIPQARCDLLDTRRRNLTGRTGCGLCGAETLADAIRPIRRLAESAPVDPQELLRGFEHLAAAQSLNRRCGAVHAAALLHREGELLVREDVGRHNAVDKVIGAAGRAAFDADVLLVTSRASYEIVHKAAQAGCSVVAAISAPTALATRLADQAGLTLIGFVRDGRLTVYAGTGRLRTPAPARA